MLSDNILQLLRTKNIIQFINYLRQDYFRKSNFDSLFPDFGKEVPSCSIVLRRLGDLGRELVLEFEELGDTGAQHPDTEILWVMRN